MPESKNRPLCFVQALLPVLHVCDPVRAVDPVIQDVVVIHLRKVASRIKGSAPERSISQSGKAFDLFKSSWTWSDLLHNKIHFLLIIRFGFERASLLQGNDLHEFNSMTYEY